MTRFGQPVSPASIVGALLFAVGLSALAAPATAGQGAAAPASIVGQVTDGTGAVLPGVTVTATSPALQVPSVTTVTDDRGDYRLSPLPIGVYTVSYELAGFQMLRREGVRLTVGFSARVDQVMNLGAVSESITVFGGIATGGHHVDGHQDRGEWGIARGAADDPGWTQGLPGPGAWRALRTLKWACPA